MARTTARVWAAPGQYAWPRHGNLWAPGAPLSLSESQLAWYHAVHARKPIHATILQRLPDGSALVALEPGVVVPPELLWEDPTLVTGVNPITAAADAVYAGTVTMSVGYHAPHARNAQGWLCCSKCNTPNEYAEPPAAGPYVCGQCRSWERLV